MLELLSPYLLSPSDHAPRKQRNAGESGQPGMKGSTILPEERSTNSLTHEKKPREVLPQSRVLSRSIKKTHFSIYKAY